MPRVLDRRVPFRQNLIGVVRHTWRPPTTPVLVEWHPEPMFVTVTREFHQLDTTGDAWCDACGSWSACVTRVAEVDGQSLLAVRTYESLVCTACGHTEVTR